MAGNLDVSMVLRLIDEASAPLRAIVAQMEALHGAAGKASGGAAVNLGGVSATVEKMDLLAKTIAGVGQPAAAATAAMDRLETATASLSAPVNAATEALDAQARALQAVEGAATAAATAQRRVGGAMPGGVRGPVPGPSKADKAMQGLTNAGLAGLGFQQLTGAGAGLKHPVIEAVNTFADLQKQAVFVANASEQEGQWAKIADRAIAVARATHTSIASVLAGERFLAGVGGAKFLKEIAPYEVPLNKVGLVSQTDQGELYYIVQKLMDSGNLTARDAVQAVKNMYQQGKDGPFELKNMARFIPQLMPSLQSQGASGVQFLKDLTPVLQVMRKGAGDPEMAATMLEQMVMSLSRPGFLKNIKKQTGVDIPAVRAAAINTGQDPIMAELNAIADRVDKMVTKGADRGLIFGALGRGRYFGRAMSVYSQHRGDLAGLTLNPAEANKTVALDFKGVSDTIAAHQQDQSTAGINLAYKAGAAQEGLLTGVLKAQTSATNLLSNSISAHPQLTSAAGGAAYVAGGALEGVGKIGIGAMGISTLINTLKLLSASVGGVATSEAAVGVGAAAAAEGFTALLAPLLLIAAPLAALGVALAWLKGKTDHFHKLTAGQKADQAEIKIQALTKTIQSYPAGGGQKQLNTLKAQLARMQADVQNIAEQQRLYPPHGRGIQNPPVLGKVSHLPPDMQALPAPLVGMRHPPLRGQGLTSATGHAGIARAARCEPHNAGTRDCDQPYHHQRGHQCRARRHWCGGGACGGARHTGRGRGHARWL